MANGKTYDLLIKGGEVVDPGSGFSGQLDVAVNNGKIAAVEAGIDAGSAAKVVDAAGKLVTPGLIDLHTHVYWGSTFWGIEPDPVAARTGLPPGSTSAARVATTSRRSGASLSRTVKSRVYALLNISSIGLTGPTWELANIGYLDVPLAQTIIEANRDVIRRRQGAYRFQHHPGRWYQGARYRARAGGGGRSAAHGPYRRRAADHRRGHGAAAPRRHPHPLLYRATV